MRQEVRVPDIGDFDEVDIIEVLVAPGDEVEADGSLVTLESDKASMDIPAPVAGTVVEVAVSVGDKVGEGDLIAVLEVEEKEEAPEEDDQEPAAAPKAGTAPAEAGEKGENAPAKQEADSGDSPEPAAKAPPPAPEPVPADGSAPPHASPSVRRFARELGVDLRRVSGSGRKGRILHDDVKGFVKGALEAPAAPASAIPEVPKIDFAKFGPVERVGLSRIQRRSKENLHRSWLNVPHVTQFDEADVTELEEHRKANREKASEEGVKLTPLAYFLKATVAALRDHPRLRSSLAPEGDAVIIKDHYHLGIAVDTEDGLVVPVVRDVDKKGLFELAGELGEISARARDKKLRPQDVQGAVFTVSSLGGIGGTAFTPIVNAPEVAILGISRTRWSPVWKDDAFVPRLMLPLSLSYDHRVVDGAEAVRFTTRLAAILADVDAVVA